MERYAGLETVIAVLVGVGWLILKALINRREEADSWDEPTATPAPRPHVPQQNRGTPPVVVQKRDPRSTPPPRTIVQIPHRRPKPTAQSMPPPTVYSTSPASPARVPTVTIMEEEGPAPAARGLNLQQTIAARFAEGDRQTMTRPATVHHRPGSESTLRLRDTFHHPATIRQALLASFVLNPPKSLEQ